VRTIYVRSIDRQRQTARVTIARPRRTRRKWWLPFRARHLVAPMAWLEIRNPRGGIVPLWDCGDKSVAAAGVDACATEATG
jgi:hypothetical protein